jgi:hypothetical protein
MAELYVVEVKTIDPSNIEIFADGIILKETDEHEVLRQLVVDRWKLSTSHAFVKNNVVHEKYFFVRE